MSLGLKIMTLRKEKGITQQELSIKTNISQSHISQIEDDKREPSIGKVLKIADALEVEISRLIK